MRLYSLHSELLVRRPLAETFAFFEKPANLAKITPSWLNFKLISRDSEMREGAQFDYAIKWLGLSMKWRSRISKYDPPLEFVDEQVIGPYHTWHHRHTFRKTTGGVIVGDDLEYSLPLGPLGALAQKALVRRQLLEIFRFRQLALTKIFEGQTQELVRPTVS